MNPLVRRIAPSIVLVLLAISAAFTTNAANNFDPTQFSTGDFHGCPPTGNGGDPYLNSLKNRDKAPTQVGVFTVPGLVTALPKTLPARKIHRDKWNAAHRDTAAKWENHAVIVEGYLLHVVQEKPEACNCNSPQYLDHHLWLAATASTARSQAVVVEVSPRAWTLHPSWKDNATFQKVINSKTKVRVSGWLTWDQEHAEQLRKTRKTLWEIHPIHSIQVFQGNEWVLL